MGLSSRLERSLNTMSGEGGNLPPSLRLVLTVYQLRYDLFSLV